MLIRYAPGTLVTASFSSFAIRPATPDDAEALIAHVHAITVEAADCLPMRPGEFHMTVEQERDFLAQVAASENDLFLVAECDKKLVGEVNYAGGKRYATRHAATLGISVRGSYQRRGIGSAMLAEAIRKAKSTTCLRRVELLVYADNRSAIRLYERQGFLPEGIHRKAIRRGEELIDQVRMALVW